jgi:hypothetical protein
VFLCACQHVLPATVRQSKVAAASQLQITDDIQLGVAIDHRAAMSDALLHSNDNGGTTECNYTWPHLRACNLCTTTADETAIQ